MCHMCCGKVRFFEASNSLNDYKGCGEFIVVKVPRVRVSDKLVNVIYLEYN